MISPRTGLIVNSSTSVLVMRSLSFSLQSILARGVSMRTPFS